MILRAALFALSLSSVIVLGQDPPVDPFSPLAKPDQPVPPFAEGKFAIESDQNIVIFGGANAAELNRSGWFETRLITAFPKRQIRVRNLAWPADTVYKQWRPRNFFSSSDPEYGEKDGREPIPADIAFVWFGQMESLEGDTGLAKFEKSYISFIDQLATKTGKIVLVTPVPFSDPLGLGFDLNKRNADLKNYADTIRKIAAERKLPLADLSKNLEPGSISRDGALLSDKGHERVAEEIALQLRFSYRLPPNTDYIRQSVQEKNALWLQYWMPSNWAFLYGNRQSQPSSRDHTNPKERWFPKEIKGILPTILKLEEDVHGSVAR